MTLEEFIQDCIAIVAARRAERDSEETRKRGDFERLLTSVLAVAVEQVNNAIPEPLREFVAYDGEEPDEGLLRGFPARWFPTNFKVEAPGLLLTTFTTTTAGRVSQVVSIKVGEATFGSDWIEAVAAAAEAGGIKSA